MFRLTHSVWFTLLIQSLTLQKVRPVFVNVLPCTLFVQQSSKEANNLNNKYAVSNKAKDS